MKESTYIYRTDRDYSQEHSGYHGYAVRLMTHSKTDRVDKFFGDATYGSKHKAFAAAKAYRDLAMKTMSKRYTDGKRGPRGVVFGKGVVRVRRQRKNARHAFYLAYYSEAGVRYTKTWSVKKHGEEGARIAAETWRKEKTAHLIKGKGAT